MKPREIESFSSLVKIEYISVHIDPETLADPGHCLLCGGAMDNVLLEYEFQDNPRLWSSKTET